MKWKKLHDGKPISSPWADTLPCLHHDRPGDEYMLTKRYEHMFWPILMEISTSAHMGMRIVLNTAGRQREVVLSMYDAGIHDLPPRHCRQRLILRFAAKRTNLPLQS